MESGGENTGDSSTVEVSEYLAAGDGTTYNVEDNDGEDGMDSVQVVDTEGQGDILMPLLTFQDRFLPIANVSKIMKTSIPKSGKIAKDAKECVQECVSEFISFVTSEASERCQQEKRKTINGEDILYAMSTLGFDNYVEPLKLYLQRYRDAVKGDKLGSVPADDSVQYEFGDDAISAQTLAAANILPGEQGTVVSSGGNIIYTTSYNQIQQIQF